jgi:hypothetical protein
LEFDRNEGKRYSRHEQPTKVALGKTLTYAEKSKRFDIMRTLGERTGGTSKPGGTPPIYILTGPNNNFISHPIMPLKL